MRTVLETVAVRRRPITPRTAMPLNKPSTEGIDMDPRAEQTLVSGHFGTVTNKRVNYNRSKGWFSGGWREDIPLKHVTSVRLDTSRHIVWGLFLVLLGTTLLPAAGLGLIFLALSVLLIWGSPQVVVNTAGRDVNAAQGWPWQRDAANEFVEAVRHQMVAE